MARAFVPVVLTANDLVEGDAIWWTGADWSRALTQARIYTDEATVETAEGALSGEALRAVGIYRVEVEPAQTGTRPVLRREQIRADRRPSFDYLPASDEAASDEAAAA